MYIFCLFLGHKIYKHARILLDLDSVKVWQCRRCERFVKRKWTWL